MAGALAGYPIRTAKAVTVDLDVPADAEIVIEGLIDPELLEPEGPFGESHGYVALEDFNMSMQVTAITHQRAPVFVSIVSQVTPSESSVIKRVAYEPVFLSHLRDTLSVKGIRKVVLHEPLSNIRPVIFLQFAPGTPQSEVWRGLNGASALKADCGKIVIAVSEDIDPRNADAVLWSLAYRAHMGDDLHVVPHRSGGHGPKTGRRGGDSTLLIDATLKSPMPPAGAASAPLHGTRARHVGRARPPGAQAAAALAWLFARRMGRGLGSLRRARRGGPLGGERRRDLRAPARGAHAGNAGAGGGGEEAREGVS